VIARDRLAHDSLGLQAESIREGLGGLSEDDQLILRDKPGWDQGESIRSDWASRLERALREVEQANQNVARLREGVAADIDPGIPAHRLLAAVQSAILALLEGAETGLAGLLSTLSDAAGEPHSALNGQTSQWSSAYAQFSSAYQDAAQRSTAHAEKLEELALLEARRRELKQALDTHAQELELLGDPAAGHHTLRGQWRGLQTERTTMLAEQCETLMTLSDQLISARVLASAGTADQEARFKVEVQGSGVRSAKIEAFLASIAVSPDPLNAWHDALDELEARVLAASDHGAGPSESALLTGFTASDLAKFVPKLTPEAILELSLLRLGDQPVFEYRAKEGEHIAFEDASAGQQATALLRVLLNQGGPPLVIDQPEDDLDSEVIQEIVSLIWAAKRRRQLIFSSHNANLVVNGDAELVACFNYRASGDHSAGQIELQGAIDVPAVQKKITQVMEGGEKAFRLRKEKYGF